MAGLPLGASQQHEPPAELLDYDGIAGIGFIEVNIDLPYPRSAAYRPSANGAQMRLRDNVPDTIDIDLTPGEAQAYLRSLVDSGMFSWQRVYRPSQGTFVNVSSQWRLEVAFVTPASAKRVRPFKVEGEASYPDNYEHVRTLLMAPMPKESDNSARTEG